jgi:hypothetical protein
VKAVLAWIKDKLVAANEDGIPIPLIRDQHMNGGTLPGTMFLVTFTVAILTLIGKVTKFLGDVDYANVRWLLGITGSFWALEALGKTISISKNKFEVGATTEGKTDGTSKEN